MNDPSPTLPLPRGGQGEVLLALDYGGTKLSAAITTPSSRVWLDHARVLAPPNHNARYDQAAMLDLARKILNGRQPSAVGVSFGGPVDATRGVVILSHHVPGWENFPLRDQLQKEFGAPATVDNDANVAALGEYKFGAGFVETLHATSLLCVTVSTGVGGGWILDGKIFHGAESMAGEIGHTIVQPRPERNEVKSKDASAQLPQCVCGRYGCVESLASGPAIARDARARLVETMHASSLRAFAPNRLHELTALDVASTANDGDELAQEIMDNAAHALGFGIGTAITLMNPERVVIGGGVSKSGERWWRGVRESARANTLPQMRVDIVPAALGDDTPLWGAVALAEAVSSE